MTASQDCTVSVIYSTIRKMGNKDNSRMNLEKTAVVLKSILAESILEWRFDRGLWEKRRKLLKCKDIAIFIIL